MASEQSTVRAETVEDVVAMPLVIDGQIGLADALLAERLAGTSPSHGMRWMTCYVLVVMILLNVFTGNAGIAAISASLLLMLLWSISSQRRRRRAEWNRSFGEHAPVRIVLSAEGIREELSGAQVIYHWSYMSGWKETDELFACFAHRAVAAYFMKRWMDDKQQAALRRILGTYIPGRTGGFPVLPVGGVGQETAKQALSDGAEG